MLAGWRGREDETGSLVAATLGDVGEHGEGLGVTVTQWARAVLNNGLGRFDDALAAAEEAGLGEQQRQRAALGLTTWALVELVEAAARGRQRERAAGAFELLAKRTRASGTEWALGTEARSRALLADGEAAEHAYLEAIERLGRAGAGAMLARTHLVYGEWLRGERRRGEAGEQLRTAHAMFTTMGLDGFAQRAARALPTLRKTARLRPTAELTTQEGRIARLARDGLSNPEIGGRLFISPRTVEYHLSKVFSKLEIGSRRELAHALGDDRAA
jgi:DNA-binding CsgD family transcriptional regulator